MIELIYLALLIIVTWLFWDKVMKVDVQQGKYLDLYDLYKLNEQLKERGLSFEALDVFERETFKRKNKIEIIDSKYNSKEKKAK